MFISSWIYLMISISYQFYVETCSIYGKYWKIGANQGKKLCKLFKHFQMVCLAKKIWRNICQESFHLTIYIMCFAMWLALSSVWRAESQSHHKTHDVYWPFSSIVSNPRKHPKLKISLLTFCPWCAIVLWENC